MDCIFCSIVAGDAPAHVVWDDPDTMALLDIHPASRGHTLVIPRVHADDIWSISIDSFAAVSRTVKAVSELLDQQLEPDGLTLFQANRPAGWQTVFHFHVHVVPRYVDDGLVPPWRGVRAGDDHLADLADVLGGRKQ